MNERLEFIKRGWVLGVSTVKQQFELANILVNQLQTTAVNQNDLENIWRAGVASLTVVGIVAVIGFLFYGLDAVKRLRNIIMAVFLSLAVFGFFLWYQYRVIPSQLTRAEEQRLTPKNILLDRLSPETVTVEWQTEADSLGAVLWGYDRDHLDDIQLDSAGDHKGKSHQLVLSVAADKPVYLVIVSDGSKYWEDQAGQKPYELIFDNKYQLENVKTQ